MSSPYSYTVSLRVIHPNMDPMEISQALPFSASRMWKAGVQRQTPKGQPLEGTYQESYWYTKLGADNKQSSDEMPLEDYLLDICQQLEPHRDFFAKILKENGRIELFIGIFGDSNFGIEISPQLLTSLSKHGLSLGLDIYPAA